MTEEHVLQEPHRIFFVTVPDVAIKEEFFDEDLQSEQFLDKSTFSYVSTIIKEEIDVETNKIENVTVKQESMCEESQHDQLTDRSFISDTSVGINEETIVQEDHYKNQSNESEQYRSKTSQVLSLSQMSVQENTSLNFECDMYNKQFAMANHLSKHKLIHSGIKKYQCNVL